MCLGRLFDLDGEGGGKGGEGKERYTRIEDRVGTGWRGGCEEASNERANSLVGSSGLVWLGLVLSGVVKTKA